MNFIHFGLRIEIERLYLEWCAEEGIANKPNSMVVFLMEKGWLNERKIIEDLKTKNCSEKSNDCDTCRHNKLEWYSEVCDGCSKAHSNYEPKIES